MKVSSSLLYIPRDLLAQRLHGRKLDLITQPIEEADFDFALRRQFEWMKVQQVRLNGKRICTKRRTIAHIRHGIKPLGPHARPRDIDAVLRHELFVARQVDGGHGVLRAITAPAPRRGQNTEWARQQMPSPAYPSFAQQPTNVTAR